jgi:hypothetical protein
MIISLRVGAVLGREMCIVMFGNKSNRTFFSEPF